MRKALIQSEAYFKASMARRTQIVGAETLSRVIDPSYRDSMIFSDGAGACVLECMDSREHDPGVLGSCAQTHSVSELNYINMDTSYDTRNDDRLFMKMKGRKVYEYALTHVPVAMKDCLDTSGVELSEIKKIFIHQANEKMDEEIVKRLFDLYGLPMPNDIMPMNVNWLGNSSVATVPTVYHIVTKKEIEGHEIAKGDIVLLASVGAGMSINEVCYRL